MDYRVVETFVSINGEGLKVGELACFIRFAGCNLECSYCDTKWANKEDVSFEWMSKEAIYKVIKETGVNNVTLTGGEPLIQAGILELLDLLSKDSTLKVEVETNGSIDLKPYKERCYENISFTMDYKLEESHMVSKMYEPNLKRLTKQDVIKFVISSDKELKCVDAIINGYELANKSNVLLSPVYGLMASELIVKFMKDKGLNGVKLQLQLHKIIWNPEARGV